MTRSIQGDLLARATPLYIQLMFGFYLNSTSGNLKLRSLLDVELNERMESLEEFNQLTNLFNETNVELFQALLSKIKCLNLASRQCRAALSYILLFDLEILKEENLKDFMIINKVSNSPKKYFESCSKKLDHF